MSQPRKQHFLPQFYLRGFSLDGRGIYQIEKASGKYYGCQIKDTAAVKDFHVLDYEDVEDPHALEKRLADLEGMLSEHMSRLLSEGVENREATMYTLQLLSVMRLRVPAFKEHIERSFPSTIRRVAERMEREGRLPKPPPGLEELLKVENLNISILNWKSMEVIFKIASSDDALSILYSMRARLYSAPPGMAFATSDQPVALFHPAAKEYPQGVGMNTAGVQITLPLSSGKLLRLDHHRGPHENKLATPAEAREFNRRTIAMADRYVFAPSPTKELIGLCEATSRVRAGFIFDDFDYKGGFVQLQRYIAVGPQ